MYSLSSIIFILSFKYNSFLRKIDFFILVEIFYMISTDKCIIIFYTASKQYDIILEYLKRCFLKPKITHIYVQQYFSKSA